MVPINKYVHANPTTEKQYLKKCMRVTALSLANFVSRTVSYTAFGALKIRF